MVTVFRHDVHDLHHHRAIWLEVAPELVRVSPRERISEWHYTRLYVDRQAFALRRLVDQDPDSLSLTRLLTELAEHPVLRRARRGQTTATRLHKPDEWSSTSGTSHWWPRPQAEGRSPLT